jgi:hypothetical protein
VSILKERKKFRRLTTLRLGSRQYGDHTQRIHISLEGQGFSKAPTVAVAIAAFGAGTTTQDLNRQADSTRQTEARTGLTFSFGGGDILYLDVLFDLDRNSGMNAETDREMLYCLKQKVHE